MVRLGLDQFCHKNSACHQSGDDKMFNFTKPFERNHLVIRKRICSQWSISTIIFICTIAYEDYIFLCFCSLPPILCCAFTYFPHLSTTPFTKPFTAKWHCLQCYFLNFLLQLICLYLSATSCGNNDYYCT